MARGPWCFIKEHRAAQFCPEPGQNFPQDIVKRLFTEVYEA